MTAANLIQVVEAKGGHLRLDGPKVVISPRSVAIPLQTQLIEHKVHIVRLLRTREESSPNFFSPAQLLPPSNEVSSKQKR